MIFRLGLFYCAAPLSGAIGGLLATGLAEIRYNGYNRKSKKSICVSPDLASREIAKHKPVELGWPWIFIIEGVSSITNIISQEQSVSDRW